MVGKPQVLLVHGAWHGSWCWERVRAALDRRAIASTTIELPSCGRDPVRLGGLVEDAAAIATAAAATPGDVVICAHSYGGMPLTEADLGPNVRQLVFLAAFMPIEGASLVSHFPALPPFVEPRNDGSVAFVPALAGPVLYGDCTPEDVAWATGNLVLHSAAAITMPVSRCSWRAIRSTYVVCTEDQTIPPELQRVFAGEAAERTEINSSHSPMISQPERLAGLIAGLVAHPAPA